MDSNDKPNRLFETLHSRRRVLLAGASVSTALLAGCTGTSDDADPTDDSDDGQTDGEDGTADGEDGTDGSDQDETSGSNFRLLVSDMPADIGDFDRLNVTLDRARIFDGEAETEDEGSDGSDESSDEEESEKTDDEESPETDDEESDETNDPSAADDAESPDGQGDDIGEEDENDDTEDSEDGGIGGEEDTGDGEEGSSDESGESSRNDGDERVSSERGFYVLDLDDPTVDLTQVVGDRAMPVFEGKLSAGTYQKIELHVADIEGVVDGEQVGVKVPSGKLQITTPFEIRAESTVDFVFDINVVKRGQQASYNLTPVISGSGVAGEDVAVEEVGDDDEDEEEDEDDETESTDEDGDGDEESTDESEDGADADVGGADAGSEGA